MFNTFLFVCFCIFSFCSTHFLMSLFIHALCGCECYWWLTETSFTYIPCQRMPEPSRDSVLAEIYLRPNEIKEFFLNLFSMLKQNTLLSYSFFHIAIISEFSRYHRAHINALSSNWPELPSKSSTINHIFLNWSKFKCFGLHFILET